MIIFLKRFYFIYLFLERGEGREKGKERNDVWEKHWSAASRKLPDQDQATAQAFALTWHLTSDL